jgi:chromosome segregation ATPase
MEQLREELDCAHKKLKVVEKELEENQHHAQKEIEYFQQLLAAQQEEENQIETVVSTTSSLHLRRELEGIKRQMDKGNQETKALEARYIDILNEKIGLEHQCKQLQLQLEHQSSNLTAFQMQLHEIKNHKKSLESALQSKEVEWKESCQESQELQKKIKILDERFNEQELVQDKYEQLKDEWKQLSERLEEAIEIRSQLENHLTELESLTSHQEAQLQESIQQLQGIHQEKHTLEAERDQIKTLLEESEMRLKVAQQHLAKKVKEGALLSEKVEEQQAHLADFLQNLEHQKTQITQLQASVELYQRQEKRLQEQLHDALKGTESQVAKWEEKYFRMYDKWQESENKIRELKKFEEKHQQVQSLLANLGNFMGGSFNNSGTFHPNQQEAADRFPRPLPLEAPISEDPSAVHQVDPQEERYDLFGMKQPQEKHKPNLFS